MLKARSLPTRSLLAQGVYDVLRPKRTSLKARLGISDEAALDFLGSLLTVDPSLRPTAEQALAHPWLADAATDAA